MYFFINLHLIILAVNFIGKQDNIDINLKDFIAFLSFKKYSCFSYVHIKF